MAILQRIRRPLARLIRGQLRRMGYRIEPFRPSIRDHWMKRLDIDLVVDVGANEGQFVGWMRGWGYTGRIVSFEPMRSAFDRCRERWSGDPRWAGAQLALGESDAQLEIQVAGNSMSSSLLPMLRSHVEAAPQSAIVATEAVAVRRLDQAILPHMQDARRLFLKVDTQGYEAQVLLGATGILDQVAFIELELSMVPLYAGQALLPEMMTKVANLGYTPVALEPGFANYDEGRVFQMDGLFVRNDLLKG